MFSIFTRLYQGARSWVLSTGIRLSHLSWFGESRFLITPEIIIRREIGRMLGLSIAQTAMLVKIMPMPAPVQNHQGPLPDGWDLDEFLLMLSVAIRSRVPGSLLAQYLSHLAYVGHGFEAVLPIFTTSRDGLISLNTLSRKLGMGRTTCLWEFHSALYGVGEENAYFHRVQINALLKERAMRSYEPSTTH